MMSLIPLVLTLTGRPATTTQADERWLRFGHGRSMQVFKRTVPCDVPTTFRFAIGKGPAMRADMRVTPCDFRDDAFAVTSLVLTATPTNGALVGTVATGVHEFTVRPTCGTGARANHARVLISLQLRQRTPSASRAPQRRGGGL